MRRLHAPILLAALAGCAAPRAEPLGAAVGAPPLAVVAEPRAQAGNARQHRDQVVDENLPEGWEGAIWLGFGARFLGDSTLDAVSDQPHFELDLEAGPAGGALRWQMGFHYSDDSATVQDPLLGPTKSSASVFETTFGGVALLDFGSMLVPYLGVQGSLVYVDGDLVQNGVPASDSDVGVGAGWRAGARLHLSRWSFVGFDVRALLLTDLELGSLPIDADGILFALTFGTAL